MHATHYTYNNKTALPKVENLNQTTLRFSTASFRTPHFTTCKSVIYIGKVCRMKMPATATVAALTFGSLAIATQIGLFSSHVALPKEPKASPVIVAVAGIFVTKLCNCK